ncbi:ABC transporter ATP-binding protein, partial [Escherichia coli]
MKVFMNLAWFFKQEKRAYITGIILLFGVALLELVAPKVIGIVVDEINEGTLTTDKLLKWVVLLVLVGIT